MRESHKLQKGGGSVAVSEEGVRAMPTDACIKAPAANCRATAKAMRRQ